MAKPAKLRAVRYAVVGLGHIAQSAILPAFAHAKRNSTLAAFVSGDARKLSTLGRRYGVALRVGYDQYDELLASGEIDAVYIALPNTQHREYTERAAARGIHVLCEKPLATSAADALMMIDACARGGVLLMTAYRLHYERATLAAIEAVRGKIGETRTFTSSFAMQVKAPNIRLDRQLGGGPLYDIGIYCINAARHLFQAEPVEVSAAAVQGTDARFAEVEEAATCTLRFSGERLASFTCSFGSAHENIFQVLGTKGSVVLNQAYALADEKTLTLAQGRRKSVKKFGKSDQFAAELLHFSDCILEGREPVSSGDDGLRDLVVIDALYESARSGKPVALTPRSVPKALTRKQEIHRPPVRKAPLVNVRAPSD